MDAQRPGAAETAPATVNTWMRGADMGKGICSVEGCGRPHQARSLCTTHLMRVRRTGSPGATRPVQTVLSGSAIDRFWPRVDRSGSCWLWLGGVDRDGYGKHAEHHRRSVRAHRFAYELLVGPIPAGLQLDHLCRVRRCVNPAHLEPVTNVENTLRSPVAPAAINARKTHCLRGHPFNAANTYVRPDGERACRTCRHDAYRASLPAVQPADLPGGGG